MTRLQRDNYFLDLITDEISEPVSGLLGSCRSSLRRRLCSLGR
jgi:hypothetical protein